MLSVADGCMLSEHVLVDLSSHNSGWDKLPAYKIVFMDSLVINFRNFTQGHPTQHKLDTVRGFASAVNKRGKRPVLIYSITDVIHP
jgi:hypothetical protein